MSPAPPPQSTPDARDVAPPCFQVELRFEAPRAQLALHGLEVPGAAERLAAFVLADELLAWLVRAAVELAQPDAAAEEAEDAFAALAASIKGRRPGRYCIFGGPTAVLVLRLGLPPLWRVHGIEGGAPDVKRLTDWLAADESRSTFVTGALLAAGCLGGGS